MVAAVSGEFCVQYLQNDMEVYSGISTSVYLRAVGGEVGATSSLAPKIGPLGLVC